MSLISGKLADALREYLREAEAGSLSVEELSFNAAILLKAGALLPGDSVAVVNELTRHLVFNATFGGAILGISARVLQILSETHRVSAPDLSALADEVREARAELGEQAGPLLCARRGPTVVLSSGLKCSGAAVRAAAEHAGSGAGSGSESGSSSKGRKKRFEIRLVEIAPGCKEDEEKLGLPSNVSVTRFVDAHVAAAMEGAGCVVISSHCLARVHGVAATKGSRACVLAAKRAGIPVVALVPLHAVVKEERSKQELVDLQPRLGLSWRYEDVVGNREINTEKGCVVVVAAEMDWIPLLDVDVVVTEFGGYDPGYLFQ